MSRIKILDLSEDSEISKEALKQIRGGIIFFDKHTDPNNTNDRYANAETDYLLCRIEYYQGLTYLATNLNYYD
ncbi:MAG: hypothetical protein JXB48_13565 [Candidatus Latescibacteria bacterium]|nr:hypothetical protein [Candidatus Latescibacterota bacterium]